MRLILTLSLAALAAARNALSLRGGDSALDGQFDFRGPFDELKCTFAGKNNETACAAAVTVDGEPCSFCTEQDAGLCVDPKIAEQMAAQNDQISCTNIEKVQSFLRSPARRLEDPWDELKCMFEGRADETLCAGAVNDDGKACDYCTLTEDGHEAGLCVDPIVAEQMKQLNKDVSCSSSKLEASTEGPFDKLKCTFAGKNNETACAAAVTVDGEPCSFCTEQDAGLCVDPKIAEQMAAQNDQISCTNIDNIVSHIKEANNPISDCDIDGIDHDTCLNAAKVNGSNCIWCDAGIGGFCFPKSWEDKASKFLTCESSVEVKGETQNEETLGFDPDDFDSNCYKVGLHGGTPDDCEKTIDAESGENCVFCNSPNIGGIGLCMPSKFHGKEGHFYTCVNNERIAAN